MEAATLQQQLEEVEARRARLERELAAARAELQTVQREDRSLPAHHPHRARLRDSLQTLESRVRELTKKCELENVRHEELSLEMTALKQRAARRQSWASQRSLSADMSNEASTATTYHSENLPLKLSSVTLTASSPSLLLTKEGPVTSESRTRTTGTSQDSKKGIDQILAQIERDNRILAELEKPQSREHHSEAAVRMPHSLRDPPSPKTTDSTLLNLKASISFPSTDQQTNDSLKSSLKSTVTLEHLDKLMAKLENDNRILAELDKKRAHLTTLTPTPSAPTLVAQTHPAPQVPEESVIPSEEVDYIDLPGRGRVRVCIARYSYDPLKQSPNENPEAELYLNAGEYILISGDIDEDGFYNGELLDGRKGLVPSNFIEKLTGEDLYDFQATVIYGTRDSDESSASFSYAQDMDLAPEDHHPSLAPDDFHRINDYIEMEDLEESMQDPIEVEKSCNKPVPHPQRLILERQLNKSVLIGWLPPSVNLGPPIENYHVYVDGVLKSTVRASERTRALLEGVDSSQPHRISVRAVTANGAYSKDAACTIVIGKDVPLAPSYVRASAVTAHSAIISWLPSNSNFQHAVAVNSVEVKVVRAGVFRHLVAGLTANTVYRVAVRTRPGRLLYNDEKNPRKLELLTAYVDFRTFPKALPDPPVNIQVEAGPQDGTVLVTWLPVTLSSATDAPVSGYAVFAGPHRIAEVDSPTGDHALIDVRRLQQCEQRRPVVTVRTRSGDALSSDSMPAAIPDKFLHPTSATAVAAAAVAAKKVSSAIPSPLAKANSAASQWTEPYNQPDMQHHTIPAIEITKDSASEANYSEEDLERAQQHHLQQQQQQHARSPSARSPKPHQQQQATYYPAQAAQTNYYNNHPQKVQQAYVSSQPTQQDYYNSQNHPQQQAYPYSPQPNQIYSSYNSMQQPQSQQQQPFYDNQPHVQKIQSHFYDNQVQVQPPQPAPKSSYYTNHHSTQQPPPSQKYYNNHPQPQEAYYNSHVQKNQPQQYYNNHHHNVQQQQQQPHYYDNQPVAGGTPYYKNQPYHQQGTKGDRYERQYAKGTPRGRWFVALFDYDPKTMSPNPDAADEELPFQEGQLIRIIGDKDVDGFYRGECNGRQGLVPCNMVSEVQMDENNGPQVRKMVALYDYDPRELSPNVDSELELTFKTGDVIYIHGAMDEDGFFLGELNGRRGLVPSNFLAEASSHLKESRGGDSPTKHIYDGGGPRRPPSRLPPRPH